MQNQYSYNFKNGITLIYIKCNNYQYCEVYKKLNDPSCEHAEIDTRFRGENALKMAVNFIKLIKL